MPETTLMPSEFMTDVLTATRLSSRAAGAARLMVKYGKRAPLLLLTFFVDTCTVIGGLDTPEHLEWEKKAPGAEGQAIAKALRVLTEVDENDMPAMLAAYERVDGLFRALDPTQFCTALIAILGLVSTPAVQSVLVAKATSMDDIYHAFRDSEKGRELIRLAGQPDAGTGQGA